MMDGPIHSNSPPDVSEGGSKHPILPVNFSTKSFEDKISVLQGVSDKLGYQKAWNKIVTPWLQQSTARMVMTNRTSEPSADTAGGGGRGKYSQVEGDLPHCPVYHPSSSSTGPLKENPVSGNAVADTNPQTHMPKTLQDLVTGLKPSKPWQEATYSADNVVWQGAAQRRRAHPRRSNVALGTCFIDLSGPHEPTPRPGGPIAKNPCHYFLAVTVRPDMSTQMIDQAVQTSDAESPMEQSGTNEGTGQAQNKKKALYYAALLGSKDEAAKATRHVLAQINNDHANFPTEIVFRLHSDMGGEFVNVELNDFCDEHGIHKTTTAGYDPNANQAETAVGILNRRSRYLLSGCRLPTNWWGLAVLAAAQLCRVDAGLGEYPAIPFGTRVMIVQNPTPRNKFVPRAEPGTVFGPSSSVSGGMWCYQKGIVKCRTNLAVQGMSPPDISWVKIEMSNWDPPDAPLPLPNPELYDAASLVPTRLPSGAATRETATCPSCLQVRRKQKVSQRHTLVWGECQRATPPPDSAEQGLPEVVVQGPDIPDEAEDQEHSTGIHNLSPSNLVKEDDEDVPEDQGDFEVAASLLMEDKSEGRKIRFQDGTQPGSLPSVPEESLLDLPAASGTCKKLSPFDKLRQYPHACMALSDIATWGSSDSASETDLPSSSDELLFLASDTEPEVDAQDDFAVQGGNPLFIEEFDEDPSDNQPMPTPELNEPLGQPTVFTPPQIQPTPDQCDDADQDEAPVTSQHKRQRRKRLGRRQRRQNQVKPPVRNFAAAAVQAAEGGHVDIFNREAIQQLIKEESGKRIVKAAEVRNSNGPIQERWKTAAEAELPATL